MKNKIALLLPYFGKLPSYFQIWLDTAGFNSSCIDFILITDQNMNMYSVPQNVKIINRDFEQIKEQIKRKYSFHVSLEEPYKLCDLRPAYGEIFADLFKNYSFWGFCDPDVIWGNVGKYLEKFGFLTNNFDKFGSLGHLQILRNSLKVNQTYKYNDGNIMRNYKTVFSSPYSFAFDEQYSFNVLAQKNKLRIINLLDGKTTPFADINPFNFTFERNYGEKFNNVEFKYFYFSKENGLKEVNYLDNGEIVESDCMYLHLQKRNMKVLPGEGKITLIYPNVIKRNEDLLSY